MGSDLSYKFYKVSTHAKKRGGVFVQVLKKYCCEVNGRVIQNGSLSPIP